jgi:septum formation protein
MVLRLAEGKARACPYLYGRFAEQTGNAPPPPLALLVAADTVITVGSDILGKPRDREDAFHTLRRLSGREHRVLTGLALALLPDEAPRSEEGARTGGFDHAVFDLSMAETRVRFRNLDESEIHAYLDREDVSGAAGSYRVQGLGPLLLDSIEGSWSNIIGLPLELFAARARELGVRFL